MAVQNISIENFTVFETINMEFSSGINVIIGENGTGKTHLLKLLYALCKYSSKDGVAGYLHNFFTPNERSEIEDKTKQTDITLRFDGHTSDHNIVFSDSIEVHVPQNFLLASVFITTRELISNAKDFPPLTSKINSPISELEVLNRLTNYDVTSVLMMDLLKRKTFDETPEVTQNAIFMIERIIGGKVEFLDDIFYIKKETGQRIDISLESDGLKKFAVLWQLLMNGSITVGTILFWDEPESNINPKLIPTLVAILFELERVGVQIFISTHDYILAKYFEVRKKEENKILFHSLYKAGDTVQSESNAKFSGLKENPIIKAFDDLLDEVYHLNYGDL